MEGHVRGEYVLYHQVSIVVCNTRKKYLSISRFLTTGGSCDEDSECEDNFCKHGICEDACYEDNECSYDQV